MTEKTRRKITRKAALKMAISELVRRKRKLHTFKLMQVDGFKHEDPRAFEYDRTAEAIDVLTNMLNEVSQGGEFTT